MANDVNLAVLLNSDGIYLSSYNRDLRFLNYKKFHFEIIGSAHNFKEIYLKIKQGCVLFFYQNYFK